MKSKQVAPTNFLELKRSFPCIIQSIEEGHPGKGSLPGWPWIYKTIYLVDGSKLLVLERVDERTNTILKYQYDWEYKKDHFWKWHNEPHRNPKHQTPEPHHMHHQGPSLTSNARIANWRPHDLIAVLETIRVFYRSDLDLIPRH